jgi:histidinol dehydrogenase
VDELNIQRLDSTQQDFSERLDALLMRDREHEARVEQVVQEVLTRIRQEGDPALLDFTRQFDRIHARDAAALELPAERLRQALETIPGEQRQALEEAIERVRRYHERQKQESWSYTEADGTVLGQQVTPLDRVGLYVPGGKAAYPSTVVMTAVPAKVAGVSELVMAAPAPDGELNELVLAAAALTGVDRVFTIGGAQAVAAMAYGTQTVPAVDKIVGPGNIYVATAKRLVFGQVGIDMVAGPSEIVVVCDGQVSPDWVAMDLFSQAEHDELAQSILISPDAAFIQAVREAIDRLLPEMERRDIIRAALGGQGALIQVADLDEAVAVVNRIAPEHLELLVEDPRALAARVRHAGAIFMGAYTTEVLGDYCVGPNHTLPTSGTARFSSPLGVYDYQKRTSLIQVSEAAATRLGRTASVLARAEGLTAHARSAEFRIKRSS